MKRKVTKIQKADAPTQEEVFRLTEIVPEFVSLVQTGANRQREFMVVKEDGNVQGDPAEPVIPETSDTGEQNIGKDSGEGTPHEDAIDLASWLTEAGDKLDEISLELSLQAAIDSEPVVQPDVTPESNHEVDEIAPTDPPPVKKAGEEAAVKDSKKIAELEKGLEQFRRENIALKAKAARLSASVGKSSVLLTGEVSAMTHKSDEENPSPSRGEFGRGGDIAAALSDDG